MSRYSWYVGNSMLCDWNIWRINEPSWVKMIQLIFKLNIDKDDVLQFLVKLWFLIRIRSQSHRLIRECLLQIIVGQTIGCLQHKYLMFTFCVKACLMQTSCWCQPSHIYSCHFIWGVLFTFWAVSVWLHFTLLYFWHYLSTQSNKYIIVE